MAGPVKAFNHAQGASAAVVGPARSRIRQIVIFADAAGAFTIKNGSASGETLITQTFPTGIHHLNIPDDGIIATDGAFISAFTGSSNELTIFLSQEVTLASRSKDKMPARNKKNFRPTKKGAGMTKAGVAAYRRKNPGSKLQTAVTGKVKP